MSIVKPVNSLRRDERYLCHLDSPAKVKYDVADLVIYGGYECKFLGERFEQDGVAAIHDLAEELGIINYADLANEIITKHKELLSTLLRYPAHFNNYCYARERMLAKVDKNTYVKYTSIRHYGSGR